MPANIKKNNVRSLDIHLINDEYWDFMLYKGECYGGDDGLSCLSAKIDLNDPDCIQENGKLYSTITWSGAHCAGIKLQDIGMTGVDNGFYAYDKDKITPGEFLKIYTGSTFEIPEGDARLFISPVTGNTGKYSYPMEIVKEGNLTYSKLTGGFYQGFFKLQGFDYQTLPSVIDQDWNFEFTLRKRNDYDTAENAVNKTHPENAGIFFYMGTRAENKFSELYNGEYSNEESFSEKCNPIITEYDEDDFFADYVKRDKVDVDLPHQKVETSDGKGEDAMNTYDISTDNKFLFFNRTATGFTTHNWEEGDSVVFEAEKREYIDNPYLLYNRTKTGYTSHDYEKITIPAGGSFDKEGKYDRNKDITGNAFALKINDDGSISYKYTVKDCEAEDKQTTLEEHTLPELIKDNEWATIHVRITALNGFVDKCGNQHPADRKMKIYIYLNGYLVFVSKELPIFNFRALNEADTKQEGVPYNISLGGGTQGLAERIWFNYFDIPKAQYELEKQYMGTFIGDIKTFKMYNCFLDYNTIRTIYNREKNLLWGK